MAITEADVRHVAMLARLALTDQQVGSLTAELGSLLGHIDELRKLDLDGVEPTAHPLAMTNRMREDVVVHGLAREEALRNAPDTDGAAFVVPAITGGGDVS
ncbi:MAG: Asp-tRNA(Asn)/Glu-tRNA(Gln) amidotransferase subunit GatC [Coriobacteriia bacterium]|nr:Asp-tRNA(Asn)/Glu-tRNA(Gln) amidotransferase subunit GatC [Coriobacteriia bacterium]MBN2847919.1 Asp-tRNA(Asn)/Glu-tRNA(Gln) amidotransferase subunit GatC [Coriobacteriia bacterium]